MSLYPGPCWEWVCWGRGWVCLSPACLYTAETQLNTLQRRQSATAAVLTWTDTDPVQHAHDVLGVSEGSDLLAALPVDDGERLQTQTLHGHFRSQQKAMVELVKELVPAERHRRTIRRTQTRSFGVCVQKPTISWWRQTPRSHLPPAANAGNNLRS